MSIDACNWAWRQQGVNPGQKLVLLSLADRADEQGVAWPSVARMAKDTCLDERSIFRHLKRLSEMGLITIMPQSGRGSAYRLEGISRRESVPEDMPPSQTAGDPCQNVTPDNLSPLTECHPCQNVTPPLTNCHPTPDNLSLQRARLYYEPKEEPKENRSCSASASPDAACADSGQVYITRKKRKLTGKRLSSFNRFWAAFAYTRGKAEAADAWLDIPELTDALVERIVAAAVKEAAARPQLEASGRTPKMAQGWISGRRWEDEPDPPRAIGPPPGAGTAVEAQVDLKTFAERCRQRDGIRTSVPSGSL